MNLGVLLIGLQLEERCDRISKLNKRILINPGTFKIPSSNSFKIEAFVLAKNLNQSDMSFSDVPSYRPSYLASKQVAPGQRKTTNRGREQYKDKKFSLLKNLLSEKKMGRIKVRPRSTLNQSFYIPTPYGNGRKSIPNDNTGNRSRANSAENRSRANSIENDSNKPDNSSGGNRNLKPPSEKYIFKTNVTISARNKSFPSKFRISDQERCDITLALTLLAQY